MGSTMWCLACVCVCVYTLYCVESCSACVVHEVRPHLGCGARIVNTTRLQQHVGIVDGHCTAVEVHLVGLAAYLLVRGELASVVVGEDGVRGCGVGGSDGEES